MRKRNWYFCKSRCFYPLVTETSLLLLNIYVLPFLGDMLQKNIENKTFKYKEDTCVTKWEAENMKICEKGNLKQKISNKALILLLLVKVLFLLENADISKIKRILVLKRLFPKTVYVCVLAYHISNF